LYDDNDDRDCACVGDDVDPDGIDYVFVYDYYFSIYILNIDLFRNSNNDNLLFY